MTAETLVTQNQIQSRIFTIRGVQVMMDRDLAQLYEVETKVLNQAVKRNIERFPESFHFQLTESEKLELVTNCDRLDSLKHSTSLPFAFTEQGVSMLSAILRSEIAVRMSVRIIEAFVAMRRYIASNAGLLQRMDIVERHLIATDNKIDKVLDCLEEGTLKEKAHIFSAGQVYDAKAFISELMGNRDGSPIRLAERIGEPSQFPQPSTINH